MTFSDPEASTLVEAAEPIPTAPRTAKPAGPDVLRDLSSLLADLDRRIAALEATEEAFPLPKEKSTARGRPDERLEKAMDSALLRIVAPVPATRPDVVSAFALHEVQDPPAVSGQLALDVDAGEDTTPLQREELSAPALRIVEVPRELDTTQCPFASLLAEYADAKLTGQVPDSSVIAASQLPSEEIPVLLPAEVIIPTLVEPIEPVLVPVVRGQVEVVKIPRRSQSVRARHTVPPPPPPPATPRPRASIRTEPRLPSLPPLAKPSVAPSKSKSSKARNFQKAAILMWILTATVIAIALQEILR